MIVYFLEYTAVVTRRQECFRNFFYKRFSVFFLILAVSA